VLVGDMVHRVGTERDQVLRHPRLRCPGGLIRPRLGSWTNDSPRIHRSATRNFSPVPAVQQPGASKGRSGWRGPDNRPRLVLNGRRARGHQTASLLLEAAEYEPSSPAAATPA